MIERIHCGTADVRATAQPASATSFTPHDRVAIGVTRLADRCPASGRNTTNFPARQRNLSPASLASHERRACAGAAAEAAAAASLQFDVVNRSTQWNLRQRQAVAE